MTPQLAQRLTIYDEPETAQTVPGDRQAVAGGGARTAPPARRLRLLDGGSRPLPSLARRQSLHRRLLATADVVAATVALFLVIALLGDDHVGLATLALMPLVAIVFKIAGLYERDQLRIVQSTLDEAPSLLQLTGLYALVVTI